MTQPTDSNPLEPSVSEAIVGWSIQNTYASSLPTQLFSSSSPAEFPAPEVVVVNEVLAEELGLQISCEEKEHLAAIFSGQSIPAGCRPIAQAYAGHQFGGFTMLGDGRAILLGEHTSASGKLVDIQLKGAGRTVYSRGGDGLAGLGPMLREYLISEAMHALRVPTTRSLAVVKTGQPVFREQTLTGAVLTRVAASHIRVGTFQFLAAQQAQSSQANADAATSPPSVANLADYTIQRHFPELAGAPEQYLNFLRKVIEFQAQLVAQWMLVGFIHGVMNTDNMSIPGETIDYGPCAFMDSYHPGTVFSSIDHAGRYAYANQPPIAQWNLARFAETLLPILADSQEAAIEIATDALGEFPEIYERKWLSGMRSKLGLATEHSADLQLVNDLLTWMETAEADYTFTFDQLTRATQLSWDGHQAEFTDWYQRWQNRVNQEGGTVEQARARMESHNPCVIPRNFWVENALNSAEVGDLKPFHELLAAVRAPFDATAPEQFRAVPPKQCGYRTFCGT